MTVHVIKKSVMRKKVMTLKSKLWDISHNFKNKRQIMS